MSAWLDAGVSEALAAPWAGHGVAGLEKVYAKWLVGENRAERQIEEALRRS